ncbi:methylenetetrahydrofolate dehydrogenase (NADP+) related protein [Thermoplasma acidophilum]|uniref:Bifunctional protein FolD n=1 Tax=Thermoplasma acidophilum (strain ATCC 25905 / DSM 1728 / JCM 9062 / NBRC 15155 / AMRC-C165) TaxID=273075 RepID=FOLD_THEAC|nr:RecName: Full=Bifunctional protein FolD; Includes: RecName: Full=Methylenetetrahydrofolate dehydrogenase; Includes: RecName: Full=Methenyltetrahydrofolate cyclohydrolase [Thermoplasma acidophilum DSM 1728]3NGL_A Chain A, Bifunctional protein folD [Thermoplasma acidophilum]3NGL_C Chain C, Bifunctional protein folD [Thermoplasma acidophilum]3NGX_A Chain A, Bifunctional protein folD [Thermoplasma acidophilum]3NGX_B Chain B, Bifunctional protein folD [Thermoplasma acidophilum]CAC12027.1 methyle
MKILRGEEIAEKKAENLHGIIERSGLEPSLKLIQIGDNEAASIYARAKIRRGKKIGIAVDLEKYDDISMKDLLKRIDDLAKDPQINGIMIENPLPKGFDYYEIVRNIPYYKDVDALSPYNQGLIALNREFLVPATPRAVIDIMDYYGYHENTVTIVNRSPVVGRPLSMMLLNRNYTVSVCHSKTKDIGSMTRSSKIVVVAVGRPGFLNREMVTPGSVVIDVGINYVNDKVVGDANFEDLSEYVEAITPVPGGVGPITATNILENVVKAAEFQKNNL